GHTYHERTEEQAVGDRKRDRNLTSDGWIVLRFHLQEIESNLQKCIEEFEKYYKNTIAF
ncbi:DUF559 domain-containing protein, partial [candidate division KSB3 bacterium]|nr:DUF559 domain-containing protein [candidate division KSB3 bacterium]MBD3327473.1 DUF559 domain-containing protein [candidate division KSB3 bacterium]